MCVCVCARARARVCVCVCVVVDVHWHCSAQLSMFIMDKLYRNKIIIIIIRSHAEGWNQTQVCRPRGGRLDHWANQAVPAEGPCYTIQYKG